jgi:pimeloyl-ACP methyl ester carboxylesterase
MAAHAAEVEELVRYRLTSPVPPAAYAAQVAAGAAHDASQRVGRIAIPTLIIAGDKDRVVPIENATLLASKMKRSTPKLISNAGHLLPIEAPEALAAAVRAFLTELAS